MARKLFVTDDMGLDDALVSIADRNPKCAMLWPWIVPYFDDWGRADANPRRLKGKIFPNFDHITIANVQEMLTEFASAGLIELYEVGGKPFMAIEREKWFAFQVQIHAAKRVKDGSKHPVPPSQQNYWHSQGNAEQAQGNTENHSLTAADTDSKPAPLREKTDLPAQSRGENTEIAINRDLSREVAENRASVTDSFLSEKNTLALGAAELSPEPALPKTADASECRESDDSPGGTVTKAPDIPKPKPQEPERKPPPRSGLLARFDVWYEAYPKKRSPGDAERAWAKLKPDPDQLAAMLTALEWQRRSPDWTKDKGQFIPYPASYLNDRAWLNEPDDPVPKPASPSAPRRLFDPVSGRAELPERSKQSSRVQFSEGSST